MIDAMRDSILADHELTDIQQNFFDFALGAEGEYFLAEEDRPFEAYNFQAQTDVLCLISYYLGSMQRGGSNTDELKAAIIDLEKLPRLAIGNINRCLEQRSYAQAYDAKMLAEQIQALGACLQEIKGIEKFLSIRMQAGKEE